MTASIINQSEAQRLADQYLTDTLGPAFQTTNGFLGNGRWYFLIQHRLPGQSCGATVGKIVVDDRLQAVIPLAQEALEDVQDCANESCTETTLILRPAARRRIQGYLTNHVSLFAKPDRPFFVDGVRPVWRANILFQTRGSGRYENIGTIDVDAKSGEVIIG
jgi:hypothetical protein